MVGAPLVRGCCTQRIKRPGKAMLSPALIRLKVFSAALLAPQKTASLKTAGSHRGVQHPRAEGAVWVFAAIYKSCGFSEINSAFWLFRPATRGPKSRHHLKPLLRVHISTERPAIIRGYLQILWILRNKFCLLRCATRGPKSRHHLKPLPSGKIKAQSD